jgi:hypothetical protein
VRRLRLGNTLILIGAAGPGVAAALASQGMVEGLNRWGAEPAVVTISAGAIATILLGLTMSVPVLRASPGRRRWGTVFPALVGMAAVVMYALMAARIVLR